MYVCITIYTHIYNMDTSHFNIYASIHTYIHTYISTYCTNTSIHTYIHTVWGKCLLMTSRLSSAMELRREAVLAMNPMQGITNNTGISLHIHTYIHTYIYIHTLKKCEQTNFKKTFVCMYACLGMYESMYALCMYVYT